MLLKTPIHREGQNQWQNRLLGLGPRARRNQFWPWLPRFAYAVVQSLLPSSQGVLSDNDRIFRVQGVGMHGYFHVSCKPPMRLARWGALGLAGVKRRELDRQTSAMGSVVPREECQKDLNLRPIG